MALETEMGTAEVMKKTWQLAKQQLGMPSSQAYCEHVWEPLFAHSRTLAVTERRCVRCLLRQRAETVWRDVREA